ncbi:MAG TPA: GNAT family N-acetyltransferase [Anaerolineales bacterium]|nr:GNAT family N-acetyltransferase [Anaerolineales bacterium]
MSVIIRPAIEADQLSIVSLIRQAKINPRNLHWQNFLIAEENGQIVGIRQVKVHSQGTREVASGFVRPEYRRQGISAQLMNEILRRENSPLYLMCNKKWKKYYEQFGFRDVRFVDLPRDFFKEYLIGKVITTLISIFTFRRINIIPMKRASTSSE